MKNKQREIAIKLRSEQGLSYSEIQKIVNVSKGTLSLWLKNIELTEQQKETLKQQCPIYNKYLHSSQLQKEKYLKIRRQYQEEGRQQAKQGGDLHRMGCMLYWAEGSKDKNRLVFSNSDIDMMKLFIRFLREHYNVNNDDIIIRLNCYIDNSLTKENIIEFWLKELELNSSNLRKSVFKSSKTNTFNKLTYGICYLSVSNTKIIQNIFGAIKEYANINDDRWLF